MEEGAAECSAWLQFSEMGMQLTKTSIALLSVFSRKEVSY